MTSAAASFGERLRAARSKTSHRLDDVTVKVREVLGTAYGPSRETIRRWEADKVPEERVDPVILAALAEIYEVPLESLSPSAERQARRIMRLLGRQTQPSDAELQLGDELGWIGMGEAADVHGCDADDLLARGFGGAR